MRSSKPIMLVEDDEVVGGVTQFAEGAQHVRLGLPVAGEVGGEIVVRRRGFDRVAEHEDFGLLLHTNHFVRLNLPVNR